MNNTESQQIEDLLTDEVNGINLLLDLTKLSQEEFIQRGIETIKSIDPEYVFNRYQELITEIETNKSIFIRAYGRGNTKGKREEYERFLKHLLNNANATVSPDKTNNTNPRKQFNQYPGIDRGKIKNYRLSHVWDNMTKNPYAFCALWNLCLTPFYIDPLTGHETKHNLSISFSRELQNLTYNKFRDSINLYNEKMKALSPRIKEFMEDENNFKNFSAKEKRDIMANFRTIDLVV